MKKVLFTAISAILLLAMLLSMSACDMSGSDTSNDDNAETEEPMFEFKSNGDGTCMLYSVSKNLEGDVTVPSVSDTGDKVSSIWSFNRNTKITSIVIPNTVTTIENAAFSDMSALESITIPSSVTSIGYQAFKYAKKLETVYIEDITAWCNIEFEYGTDGSEYYANPMVYATKLYLNDKPLTNLVIPNGITTVNMMQFYGCETITSLTIPDSVTEIKMGAFEKCVNLKDVTIPSGIENIEFYAFRECTSLDYNEYGNALYIGNSENPYLVLVKAKDNTITSCEVHSDTRFILQRAFTSCYNLERAVFENPNGWSASKYKFNLTDAEAAARTLKDHTIHNYGTYIWKRS